MTQDKESACNAGDRGDAGLIPGSGRALGGGHGDPHRYSCLENPMDRGALCATVHSKPVLVFIVSRLILQTLTHCIPNKSTRVLGLGSSLVGVLCRGPAPADPGYSKGRRSRRPIYLFIYSEI